MISETCCEISGVALLVSRLWWGVLPIRSPYPYCTVLCRLIRTRLFSMKLVGITMEGFKFTVGTQSTTRFPAKLLIPTEGVMNSDIHAKFVDADLLSPMHRLNLEHHEWFQQDNTPCHDGRAPVASRVLQKTLPGFTSEPESLICPEQTCVTLEAITRVILVKNGSTMATLYQF